MFDKIKHQIEQLGTYEGKTYRQVQKENKALLTPELLRNKKSLGLKNTGWENVVVLNIWLKETCQVHLLNSTHYVNNIFRTSLDSSTLVKNPGRIQGWATEVCQSMVKRGYYNRTFNHLVLPCCKINS